MSIMIKNETGNTCDTSIIDENGEDLIRKGGVESLQVEFGKYGDIVKAIISLGQVRVNMKANLVEWKVSDPGVKGNVEWTTVSEIITKDKRRFIYHDDGTIEIVNPIKYVNIL